MQAPNKQTSPNHAYSDAITSILQKHWNFSTLRTHQIPVIDSILAGIDTLALLPTGGGKSLCYQLPAVMQKGITIVISPLIALMTDQVSQLRKRGIIADALHSYQNSYEQDNILENAIYGSTKLLYISPERCQSDVFLQRFEKMHVHGIAVDEAHCISQWGYDFRPSYLNIHTLRTIKQEIPILALTASAVPEVIEDIKQQLHFRPDHKTIRSSFARPNLAYTALKEEAKPERIIRMLQKVPGSALVYMSSRNGTEELSNYLRKKGITALPYHAGMAAKARMTNQIKWIKNEVRVIVGTNAFGMGIDKPDVRLVIHHDLPASPEAYFQEVGRAGRDGNKAFGVLLWNGNDLRKNQDQFNITYPSEEDIQKVYYALCNYLGIAYGSGKQVEKYFDLISVARLWQLPPLLIHSVIKILERDGLLILHDHFFKPSMLHITSTREDLYVWELKNERIHKCIQFLLRNYQGIFAHPVRINEEFMETKLKIPLTEIEEVFHQLQDAGLLRYQPKNQLPKITFLHDRFIPDHFTINKDKFQFLKERAAYRLNYMMQFVQNPTCRSFQLLHYFHEKDPKPCGICDNCISLSKSNPEIQELCNQIEDLLENTTYETQTLLDKFPVGLHNQVKKAIQYLTQEGNIVNEYGVLRKRLD